MKIDDLKHGGVLIFDLDDPDAALEFDKARNANKMAMAINEIVEYLRRLYKYEDEEYAWDVRQKVLEILTDNDVDQSIY